MLSLLCLRNLYSLHSRGPGTCVSQTFSSLFWEFIQFANVFWCFHPVAEVMSRTLCVLEVHSRSVLSNFISTCWSIVLSCKLVKTILIFSASGPQRLYLPFLISLPRCIQKTVDTRRPFCLLCKAKLL